MTIEYLFHSCFVAESATAIVVYDYWRDRADQRLHRRLAQTDKQVYFVVSHFHPDHYNPAILRWTLAPSAAEPALPDGGEPAPSAGEASEVSTTGEESEAGEVRRPDFLLRRPPLYLLSYDVVKHRRVDKSLPAAVLRPGHGYEDVNLTLQAYRSTDIGVSTCTTFHAPCAEAVAPGSGEAAAGSEGAAAREETTVFHCGDLNNWYFSQDKETEADKLKVTLGQMEGLFLSVVREMQEAHPAIDHLMFPLDPRLGEDMLRGATQWLTKISVAHFYPMHYWDLYPAMCDGLQQLAALFPATRFHCPADMPESHDALSSLLTSQ